MTVTKIRPQGQSRSISVLNHTPGERFKIEYEPQFTADRFVFVVSETVGGERIFEANADISNPQTPTFDFSAETMALFEERRSYFWEIWNIYQGEYARQAFGQLAVGTSIRPEDFVSPVAFLMADPDSDPALIAGADEITNVVAISQADYDALSPPDAATLYVVTA